jgi:hypothetical protein
MFLLAIDPHVNKSTLAIFIYEKLEVIKTVKTCTLIGAPGVATGMPMLFSSNAEKTLVIERPWVGKNPKGSITLAITVGRIMGSLERSGFEVHEAPAWGNDGSWISDMLSLGRRMPTRAQVAALSMRIAKAEYPKMDIDEHSAAAILMGMWWLRKQKMRNDKPRS